MDKNQRARQIAVEQNISSGDVCVLSSLELTPLPARGHSHSDPKAALSGFVALLARRMGKEAEPTFSNMA